MNLSNIHGQKKRQPAQIKNQNIAFKHEKTLFTVNGSNTGKGCPESLWRYPWRY